MPRRWPTCWPGCWPRAPVTVCTQCAARRDINPDDVIPGIRIAGAATFVAEIMADGAQALVY